MPKPSKTKTRFGFPQIKVTTDWNDAWNAKEDVKRALGTLPETPCSTFFTLWNYDNGGSLHSVAVLKMYSGGNTAYMDLHGGSSRWNGVEIPPIGATVYLVGMMLVNEGS